MVSYSFHQICSKHLFATVELHDAVPRQHLASSKKGFVKLLESRPCIVKYIRKLTYKVSHIDDDSDDDRLLSPILANHLRTISRLNCLTIIGSKMGWNTPDSLTSALLYLMHLPTINYVGLSFIRNFPLSSLTPLVNLLRLDIFYLFRFIDDEVDEDPSEFVVLSELMPKIRVFNTSDSAVLTRKLLHAKRQDGQPAFPFMGLRQVSMSFHQSEDEQNIRYLLQNAKLLEKLHLSIDLGWSLVGLRDILSPSARTLKVLDFKVPLYYNSVTLPLAGLCEELEAMAGHNVLEALSFIVGVDGDESENFVGSIIQNVEKVLLKPGWPALRQVSFEISIACCLSSRNVELLEALQSLPDKYMSHLSKLESVAFSFSAFVVKCGL